MGFPKSFKTIEIVQECRYGFTPEYVQELCEWSVVKDFAWVLHDKDVKENGSPAEPHIHVDFRFKDSVPTSAILAKTKGVCEVQHLQKMHSWNSAIAYLTHSNRPEKYQYSDDEVHSNYDWRADREKALSKVNVDDIVNRIASGEIREWNYTKFIPAEVYAKQKRLFENAWKYRTDKLQCESEVLLMNTKVVWIHGPAGSGKTEYAKYLCRANGMEYYITSSGKDPFGEYRGQRAVILDDVRPEQFDANTLLKLLDPATRSAVQSRYRNKWLECEMIIVTCPHSPEFWWSFYRQNAESTAGSWEQLTRRLTLGSIKMTPNGVAITSYNRSGAVLFTVEMELPQEYYDGLSDSVSDDIALRIAQIKASMPGVELKFEGTLVETGDKGVNIAVSGSSGGMNFDLDMRCESVPMEVADMDAIFDNSDNPLANSKSV